MSEFIDLTPSPLALRVYGLEGITKTQDTAITAQGLTLAHHDEALNGREGVFARQATQEANIATLTARVAELTSIVKWMVTAMVGFAFTVAATGLGVAVTLH